MDPHQLSERFFIDLAVGVMPFADICALHKVTPAAVEAIEDHPVFKQRMTQAQQAVDDDGRAFRARCRSIINQSVNRMERLMADPDVPASTRLETFKTLAKYGQLEPQEKAANQGPSGPQLVFNIYGPDGQPLMEQQVQGKTIEHDPQPSPPPAETAPLAAVSGFF